MSTAVFYASSTGNTEDVALTLSEKLGNIEHFNIASCDVSEINHYDKVILGISTWGEGDLQDDWEDIWEDFKSIDLNGKTIALFGLGDQEGYGDEFVDALGEMYEVISQKGANVIGLTKTDGYEYDDSKAEIENGVFCGLVIDEDNQGELTNNRIEAWLSDIKSEIL